ncbi:MAG: NTP transferase domain-containing protein [Acidobacteria bacterium]|nr:NTP transferase domain-containing protein [Acidobacteriota bacterium]
MNQKFVALILAAGKGTRFKSDTIKLLHPILGKSMIRLVVETLVSLDPAAVGLVIGYQKEALMAEPFPQKALFVEQKEQKGTAHAVLAAAPILKDFPEKSVLVMNGDLPLVRPETLQPFLNDHFESGNDLTFLTADLDNPFGFGRLVHNADGTIRIVEEKDATPEQKKIRESNLGVYLFRIEPMLKMLPLIGNNNAKGEYYLTDSIELYKKSGLTCGPFKTSKRNEFVGVNDRIELARAAGVLRTRKMETLMEEGVSIFDPDSTWIDLDVRIGRDSVVYPFVVIEGGTVIGEGCRIGPFSRITDCRMGSGVVVDGPAVLNSCIIGDGDRIFSFDQRGD